MLVVKRRILYCVLLLTLLWGGVEVVSAGVAGLNPRRTVASIEAVADTSCPQSFRQLFCTGLISSTNCELCLPCMGDTMPDYYCDCMGGIPFHYGLDTIVSDTVWFVTKVSDILNNGMTAYWFSDSVVSIDIFIACHLSNPNKRVELTKNSSRIMSPAEIRAMLGNAGDMGQLIGNKPVYLRVAPRAEGRVLIYKYGDSFHSTCNQDSILKVFYGLKYAIAHQKETFLLPRVRVRSMKFMNWNQKDNEPARVSLVRGDCTTGDTVLTVLMTDSLKPYFFNKTLLQEAYTNNDSMYIVVECSKFGYISFHSSARFPGELQHSVDTLMCQGALYGLDQVILNDTSFADTVYYYKDTLGINSVNITVVRPDPVMDTMLLKSKQLYFFYHGQYVDHFGDYDIIEHADGGCDGRYLLHVEHDLVYQTEEKTVETCQGKTYTINKVAYSTNTIVRDTTTIDADTKKITIYTLRFIPPVLEYDTIYINKRQLPYKYEGKYVRSFGDTVMTITKRNTCTRKIRLTVVETELPLQHKYATIDTTVCLGLGLQLSDTLVYEPGAYLDSMMIAEDTLLHAEYHLSIGPALSINDTLRIYRSLLPYEFADTVLADFGEYDLYVREEDECDKQMHLTLLPETEYIEQTIDTTLCHGKQLSIAGVVLSEDTTVVDTVPLAEDVLGVRTWIVRFTAPKAEQVALQAKESELPLAYADTALGFGVHNLFVRGNGECDRLELVTVTPVEDFQTRVVDTAICFGKVMTIAGKEYRRNAEVKDTVQLSAHTWMCTTYRLSFTIPDLQYDTLTVGQGGMPVNYADTVISEYGTYQVVLHAEGECDILVELTVEQGTGLETVKNELQIVPTMAKTGQMLRLTSPESGLLQVFDVLGREVRHQNIPSGVTPIRLFQAGNYIVQLITSESILTQRIIITN